MPETSDASHAIVVGGGFAGLLAARMLSGRFRRVTILERDVVTSGTGHRSGVPQAHHPHAVLARCSQVLESLFPGFSAEMADAGAASADAGLSMRVLLPAGWVPLVRAGIAPHQVSRVTLESVVRRRVLALPGVRVLGGVQVQGLVVDSAGTTVTGVRGRRRADGTELTLNAGLVVDASGRTSRLPQWLSGVDFPAPAELIVDGGIAYTSRLYQVPDDWPHRWLTSYEITHAPHTRRGGAVTMVDGGRCYVLLIGAAGDHAPSDDAGFAAFARSLRNPDIAEVVEKAVPLSRAYRFTNTRNRWLGYHKLPAWPERLVAFGDAVCSFNPVYGQGLTVAALQAAALGDLLGGDGSLDGVGRKFQRRAARIVRGPWSTSTSTDLGWRAEPASSAARAARWFLQAMLEAMPSSPEVYRRFIRVQHMVDGPGAILHPRVVTRVLRHALSRRRDAAAPPFGHPDEDLPRAA